MLQISRHNGAFIANQKTAVKTDLVYSSFCVFQYPCIQQIKDLMGNERLCPHFSFCIWWIFAALQKSLQTQNAAWIFLPSHGHRLTKFYWHDLFHFEVLVSYQFYGQLSEPVTSHRENQKTNLERGNGKPAHQSLYLVCVCVCFHKRLGVNKCQSCFVSWTGSRSNGGLDRTAVCLPWLMVTFGRSVQWQAFADGNRKESDAGSDVLLISIHRPQLSVRVLPKHWSNRLGYSWLIQLFLIVFMFVFQKVWR